MYIQEILVVRKINRRYNRIKIQHKKLIFLRYEFYGNIKISGDPHDFLKENKSLMSFLEFPS